MAQKALRSQNNKQAKLIRHLKKEDHWLKWALGAAVVVILLLLLLLGYATDWSSGLRKSSATGTTPISSELDAQRSATGAAGANGTNTTTGSSGGTNTTGQDSTKTNSASDKSTTTTNNSTTTTTNNSTSTPASNSGLLSLYSDSSAGQSMDEVLARANSLGIGVNCDENLVLRTCVFEQNGQAVTVRSLLGSGTVTSVLKDF